MICLLVLTDGRRECIERTIESAHERLHGQITRRIIWDDSGDNNYFMWLANFHAYGFECVRSSAGRQGFGGAIRNAWWYLLDRTDEPYIFHLEDDFLFNRDVDVDRMAGLLSRHPYLAQMALLRQPWNDAERQAGGIIEQHPDDYTSRYDATLGAAWLEHRRFMTTNPCLYRRDLMRAGWPDVPQSEGHFSIRLFSEGFDGVIGPDVRSAFWGRRSDGPWVEHIGHERSGVGY